MIPTHTSMTIWQRVTPWTAQEVSAMMMATETTNTSLPPNKPWPVPEVEKPPVVRIGFAHLPLGARKIIECAITFGPCTYNYVGQKTGMTGIHAARTLKSAAENGYVKAVTRMVTTGNHVRPNIYYSGVQ